MEPKENQTATVEHRFTKGNINTGCAKCRNQLIAGCGILENHSSEVMFSNTSVDKISDFFYAKYTNEDLQKMEQLTAALFLKILNITLRI